MVHVSSLTKEYGQAQGCFGCGKQSSYDELWKCRCDDCGGRLFTKIEISWWVDSYGTYVPASVIDFWKATKE